MRLKTGLFAALCLGTAVHTASPTPARSATVAPPQGYIRVDQALVPSAGREPGDLREMTFSFSLDGQALREPGAFWSNQFSFSNSNEGLPTNHLGGLQGGYIGLQTRLEGGQQAIASIWWATAMRPGPGVKCVSELEAWYADAAPFSPRIDDLSRTDPARKVAGGPYRSCRLPLTIVAGERYQLRLRRIEPPAASRTSSWWRASVSRLTTKREQLVGDFALPKAWGSLNPTTTGFMEHFGPMPRGCASIPASTSTFFPATGNGGAYIGKLSTYAYGACEADIVQRYKVMTSRRDDGVTVSLK